MTITSAVIASSESGFVISVIARSESDEAISFEIATGSPGESPRNDRDTTFLKDEIATPPLREARNDKGGEATPAFGGLASMGICF
jgi:hypothetical protein